MTRLDCLKFESGGCDAVRDLARKPYSSYPDLIRASFHFREKMDHRVKCPVMTSASARQFNTRLLSGLSSEKVGTSISNFSPLSLTI